MAEDRQLTEVAVRFSWYDYGEITLDATKQVAFPTMPAAPGLYRLRFLGGAGGWTRAYIGETVDFKRRARQYRKPGPSQKTNVRVRTLLLEHLGAGGKVQVALVTDAVIVVGGESRTLDLYRKASRLLTEGAAIHANPEIEPLENLPGIGDHGV